ncbi:hypothetical protein LCGC14_2602470 [marine sediment metagenome]|uniref:Uncharacterized protein n=1 Tax=marine sediment metagenome TaxID=412755 RepID=A0A0F9CJC9_9ZZZZ
MTKTDERTALMMRQMKNWQPGSAMSKDRCWQRSKGLLSRIGEWFRKYYRIVSGDNQ